MVVLELTNLPLESDFKACKIGSLWKAKKATKQDKERGGHPPLILAFKNAPKPLKIHWISVAKRPKANANAHMYGSKHEEIRHARKEMTSNKKIPLIKHQEGLKKNFF